MRSSFSSSSLASSSDSPNAGVITTVAGRVHYEIRLYIWDVGNGKREVEGRVAYLGTPAALIAAGCATPEMLAPGRKGTYRRDDEGYKFVRYPRGKRMSLVRFRPLDALHELPGVTRAMVGACLKQAEKEAEMAEQQRAAREKAERDAYWEEWRKKHDAPLDPEKWVSRRISSLQFHMGLVCQIGDCEVDNFGTLDADYSADEADMQAYKQRAEAATRELADILRAMKVRRSTGSRLKLVVDNT